MVFGLPVGVFRVWCVFGVGFGVGESLARFGGRWIWGLTLKLSRVVGLRIAIGHLNLGCGMCDGEET